MPRISKNASEPTNVFRHATGFRMSYRSKRSEKSDDNESPQSGRFSPAQTSPTYNSPASQRSFGNDSPQRKSAASGCDSSIATELVTAQSNRSLLGSHRSRTLKSLSSKVSSRVSKAICFVTASDGSTVGTTSLKAKSIDAVNIKEKIRQQLYHRSFSATDLYHDKGFCQSVARNKYFEIVTLMIIALNAVWIMIDTDYNKEVSWKADPVFQIADHCFCAFYSFEWSVRFGSLRSKWSGLRDEWFVFDSVLVFLTVAETWVFNFIMMALGATSGGMGNSALLRIARLLRLSRMARMARLFRTMPEIMILIKGLAAATRTVLTTLFLLVILIYVFAIAFTQLTEDTEIKEEWFNSVPESMVTLFLYGALIDEVGGVTLSLGDANVFFGILFVLFIILAATTVLNLLIGVLVEIVSTVASAEREEMVVSYVKGKMYELIAKNPGLVSESSFDEEINDHMITKNEFLGLLEEQQALVCFQEVGVDVTSLVDFIDFFFENTEAHYGSEGTDADLMELPFNKFLDLVLDMRGTNLATVKDLQNLQKFINSQHKQLLIALKENENLVKTRESRRKTLASRKSEVPSFFLQTTHEGVGRNRVSEAPTYQPKPKPFCNINAPICSEEGTPCRSEHEHLNSQRQLQQVAPNPRHGSTVSSQGYSSSAHTQGGVSLLTQWDEPSAHSCLEDAAVLRYVTSNPKSCVASSTNSPDDTLDWVQEDAIGEERLDS